MNWQISYPSILSFVAGIIALLIMQVAWTRRRVPGAAPFALLMLAAAVWALGSALEYASPVPATRLAWAKIQYLGIIAVPPLWLTFAVHYSEREYWTHWRRSRIAIWIIPVITLLLAVTNEYHHLIWSRVIPVTRQGGLSLEYFHGTWFWIFAAYTYLLLLGGSLILVWVALGTARPYQSQTWALLIGVAIPWIANFFYLSRGSALILNDPTPVAFVITGVIYAFGVFRFQLFDLRPVALDSVVESMLDGILVLDESDRVIYLNPSAEKMLGDPHILGKTATRLFEHWPAQVDLSLPTSTATIELADADGRPRAINVTTSPLYNRFKRMAGRLILLRDITDSKRAEERLRLQSVALDSAANGILIADTLGTIIWANPSFHAITGYAPAEVVGQKTSLLKSGKHGTDFYKNLWDTISTGRIWHGQMTNRRKDGTFYVEEQTIAPVRDDQGNITHFVAVKQDVSERAEVDKLRDDLTHTLVHDLRNPLNSILVSLDMFHMVHVELPEILTDVVQISRENAWRLMSMVNAILDISKLESGQMPLHRDTIDLASLVEQTCHLQSALAKRGEILLLNNVPYNLPPLEVDATLIGRVLQNLLDNAIKFSGNGCDVEIAAALAADGTAIVVSIKDQGPGLTPEMQKHIFQKFATLDSARGGTGLGLVFCRLAVEAHGGKIWVESVPEQGTAFIFTLPITKQ
jgi:PAS domain S-box-containing protein